MSYLVLARKYRPGTFGDIVGQDHVVRTLQNAITLNRVHHAFLFTGARGVGKTTTARVLARALNCATGPTPTPCGTCAACVEIAEGRSPDVLEIDGASNRGVESVRELRETVRYLPAKGKHKLYIIDEVHQLTPEAFNALLKTLEEPPPHVKFIFATTEPQKIPATILSRCQRFDFRRVSVTQLLLHLKGILAKEQLGLSAAALAAIVREAQGSVRDALSLLDQVLSYAGGKPDDAQVIAALGIVDRQLVFDLADSLIAKNAERLLSQVAEIDLRGHDLTDLVGLLVEHFRDLMVVKAVPEPKESLLDRSPGEIQALAAQARALGKPDLHRCFQALVAVADDVSRSPFPRVSLEMGLLRIFEIESVTSLADLLQKLDHAVHGDAAPAVSARAPVVAPPPPVSRPPASGWDALVARMRQLRPALASLLEHGRPLEFGQDKVAVGYTKGTFYWDAAHERENRALMERVLAEHFGKAVTLELCALDTREAPVATLAEVDERRRSEKESAVRAGALKHPAVQGAISILGGEVKEVIPLSSGDESA
ncbi:MAG: DNA polymerase III subunit gamma/tau [Deltaproteobacteria bacterium]|nr:DNA polymerase III subunit gamma/tau [Deltaproteobacteria bacterium]